MANALHPFGQRPQGTRNPLEFGVRLVSARPRGTAPSLFRRHTPQQHLSRLHLGKPPSPHRGTCPLRHPLRSPLRSAMRIGAGDRHDLHRLILRGVPARLPRPPWHHRICAHGANFRDSLGWGGLGSETGWRCLSPSSLTQTSPSWNDFFCDIRSGGLVDQWFLRCSYCIRGRNWRHAFCLDLCQKSSSRRQ